MSGPARVHPALRLLALLATTPDNPDECWTTTATNSPRPSMGIGRERTVRCARVSLEAKLGRELFPGMFALHHCDNPRCVRPSHLFEGTQQDNSRDMAAKRRGNTAKLLPGQADEILSLVAQGWVQADIARAYGITPTHVWWLASRSSDSSRKTA